MERKVNKIYDCLFSNLKIKIRKLRFGNLKKKQ